MANDSPGVADIFRQAGLPSAKMFGGAPSGAAQRVFAAICQLSVLMKTPQLC